MAVVTNTLPDAAEIVGPTPGQRLRRRILGHRGIVIGGVILGLIVFMALAAPLIAPYDPYAQSLVARMKPPVWYDNGSWEHWLGTDQNGRDNQIRTQFDKHHGAQQDR